MTEEANHHSGTTPETLTDLIVVSLFTVTAFLMFGLFPLVAAHLVSEGRATLAQTGRIATIDYLSLGVVSLLAPKYLSLENLRVKAILAGICCVFGNVSTMFLAGDEILLARMIAGLGGGILIWIQYAYVGRSAHAERLSGIFLAAYVTASALLYYQAPTWLTPRFGANGLYGAVACVAALTCAAALVGPRRLTAGPTLHPQTPSNAVTQISWRAYALLASVFFMVAYSSAVWVYLEPITTAGHIPTSTSENAAVVSLVMQVVGALSAGWGASRFSSRAILLIFGATSVLEVCYLLFMPMTTVGLYTFVIILGLIGYALVPFQISLLMELDPTKRSVDYFSAPFVLGGGFGPLVVSLVASDTKITLGISLALASSAISLLCLVVASTGRDPGSARTSNACKNLGFRI